MGLFKSSMLLLAAVASVSAQLNAATAVTSLAGAATSVVGGGATSVAGKGTSVFGAGTSGVGGAASTVNTGASSALTSAVSVVSGSTSHHGLSGGQIAGIVVGSVVGGLLLLGLLLLGCCCLIRKKRKAKKEASYMTEKNASIDTTPSMADKDIERGRNVQETRAAVPMAARDTTAHRDATQYMTNPNPNVDETMMKNIITPAHHAGIRTADDVVGTRGDVMNHTKNLARNIGDYPVNETQAGKMVETSGQCMHYTGPIAGDKMMASEGRAEPMVDRVAGERMTGDRI